jgi:ATP-dependent 26S proteasome regulatory subunit
MPVDTESRLHLADERVVAKGDVNVILDNQTGVRVGEFVQHVRASDELIANGVGIAPSLLMYGPPGCGKTELAKYISAELELPLLTARTDTLVSSYLGSTSKNLRMLFEHAMARPCVLFLDEVDAVAKLRDDQHELGELKRVVVSLLQNIDALDNKTVLLAATNHEHLLDRALWRRFAFHLRIDLPDQDACASLLALFLGRNAPNGLDLEHLAAAAKGMSGAEIRHVCEDARRAAVLARTPKVADTDLLLRLLRSRVSGLDALPLGERVAAARKLSPKVFTVRRLSEMFSVSTGKISGLLREGGEA